LKIQLAAAKRREEKRREEKRRKKKRKKTRNFPFCANLGESRFKKSYTPTIRFTFPRNQPSYLLGTPWGLHSTPSRPKTSGPIPSWRYGVQL
jgi:hypothetical protein